MIKKILIFLLFLLITGGGVAYYFWQQVTALPSWYEKPETQQNQAHLAPQDQTIIREAKAELNYKIQQQIIHQSQPQNTDSKFNKMSNFKEDIELKLDAQDVNNFIITTLAETPQHKHLLESTKAIQTKIENNQLAIEAIVNPSEIQQSSIPQKEKATIEKVLKTFPQLKNRDIYLEIEGKPRVKNGRLMLPKDSKIKVGNLSFTVEEITEKFGLPPEKIQQYLELGVNQMNLGDLQIHDNGITVKIKQP